MPWFTVKTDSPRLSALDLAYFAMLSVVVLFAGGVSGLSLVMP